MLGRLTWEIRMRTLLILAAFLPVCAQRDVLQIRRVAKPRRWSLALRSDYAARPRVALMNRACSTTSPLGSHLTCPFLII